MPKRACAFCGAPFDRRYPTQTRCEKHQPAPRPNTRRGDQVAPSTKAARDPAYQAIRRRKLAGSPTCHWCGAPADTLDHLVPASRGGTNTDANLVPACGRCNKSRGDRTDWRPGPARVR